MAFPDRAADHVRDDDNGKPATDKPDSCDDLPMVPAEHDRRSTAFTAASVPENYQQRLAPVVFEPWARILLDAVGVSTGDQVLDVACGTGVVARRAAERAAGTGRVVAADVSEAMLGFAAAVPVPDGAAPVEYVRASADELPFADATFDAVTCQQGLQFFGERAAAAQEMRRVVRPGGVVGVAVWADGHRLEPFDDYAEALAAAGVEPPFPGAFTHASFVMGTDEVRALLRSAGFSDVDVSVVDHVTVWPDAESAASGILGSPFGPVLNGLVPERRNEVQAELLRRFGAGGHGGPVRRTMTAVIARATAAPA